MTVDCLKFSTEFVVHVGYLCIMMSCSCIQNTNVFLTTDLHPVST